MTFSFDAALGDDVSRMRQLLNDTVDAGHKFTDEALAYYLTLGGSIRAGAALALEQLATRYAMIPDVQVGTKRMAGSALAKALTNRAVALRAASAGLGLATPYAAGLSVAELEDSYDDDDIPRPAFGVVGAQRHPRPRGCD